MKLESAALIEGLSSHLWVKERTRIQQKKPLCNQIKYPWTKDKKEKIDIRCFSSGILPPNILKKLTRSIQGMVEKEEGSIFYHMLWTCKKTKFWKDIHTEM